MKFIPAMLIGCNFEVPRIDKLVIPHRLLISQWNDCELLLSFLIDME